MGSDAIVPSVALLGKEGGSPGVVYLLSVILWLFGFIVGAEALFQHLVS